MSCHPSTPQSPSQPSPSTSDPISVSISMSAATTDTLPTPAHSVSGGLSQPIDKPYDAMILDSPQKRKRDLVDSGDRELKKAHVEAVKHDIKNLHLDVGDKYLLCRTPHSKPTINVSDNLTELYGLSDLAAELARVKPNGEKNALRKTYKGHIKRLGISGHFDAVRKENEEPTSFMAMLAIPDHEWYFQNVQGRAVQDGLSAATLAALPKAMTMSKGAVPKSVWDSSVLGELAIGLDGPKLASARPSAPSTPAMAGTPSMLARARPDNASSRASDGTKNLLRKRGFGDGDAADGSPTADERGNFSEDDRGNQKRRKKASSSCSSTAAHAANILQNPGSQQQQQPGSMRQSGYGPSAVGA